MAQAVNQSPGRCGCGAASVVCAPCNIPAGDLVLTNTVTLGGVTTTQTVAMLFDAVLVRWRSACMVDLLGFHVIFGVSCVAGVTVASKLIFFDAGCTSFDHANTFPETAHTCSPYHWESTFFINDWAYLDPA